MRSLNPDQLRTFMVVVELGSFTAAAKRLSLSQPAVSLQVRELEARCGIQLLDRHSKKPTPTEAGAQLLVHAARILRENEDALASMVRIREQTGHQVRVGMTTTTLTYLAHDTVRQLKREAGGIDLSIILSASDSLANDVRNRHLDLAIVTLPLDQSQLKVTVFHEDPVNAIVPADLVDKGATVATPEMMARLPFITQNVGDVQTTLADRWLREHGQTAHSYVEVRNLEACRAAVAVGLGVSIMPGMMAAAPQLPGLLTLPLHPPVVRRLAVIEHEHRSASTIVDQVRRALLASAVSSSAAAPVKFLEHTGAKNAQEAHAGASAANITTFAPPAAASPRPSHNRRAHLMR